jgi:hypothetical protein
MVDALRRVHRLLRPGGAVIDLHPSARVPTVEVDGAVVGPVDAADAPLRHAAAGVALAGAIDERLFGIERSLEFEFFTYGDSIDELREYIEDNWRAAKIDDAVVARARQATRAAPAARPRVREIVYATRLVRLAT